MIRLSAPSTPAVADSSQPAETSGDTGQFANALALSQLVCVGDLPLPVQLAALNLAAANALALGLIADAEANWRSAISLAPDSPDAYGGLGTMLNGLGRLAEAEVVFRQWRGLRPDYAEAHNNHGAVLQALGYLLDAEAAYRGALALRPDYLEAQYNLALVLQALGRLDDAEAAYRDTLDQYPQHAESHNNLGNLLLAQDRVPEAEGAYRRALEARPQYPLALNNLASLLKLGGRLAEAELMCRLAVAMKPDYADAHNNLGTVLDQLGRAADAEQAYRQALAVRADFAEAHYNLGIVLHAQQRLGEAEGAYRMALALRPGSVEALNNLGGVLQAAGRPADAAGIYERALALDTELPVTLYNYGTVLKSLDRWADAEAAYRRALALRADYADAQFALGTLLLGLGRYAEGWPLYEARYAMPRFVHHRTLQILTIPRWQGESLAGRSLLVWQEDGLGDMIQFGRYLPMLKTLGVARVTVACMPVLHRLMASVDGVDAVLDHDAALARASGFDCWISLMSLPLRLGIDEIGPEPAAAWLKPDADTMARWRARLAALPAGRRRIGLAWKGNPRHHNDAHRSLASLAQLAPLWALPDVAFVSLQKGQGEDEALAPPPGQPLLHLGSEVEDLADTAAIVAQLDLVICVDTAVAHLAASVGTRCWVILPAQDVDWRWGREGDDTPWYAAIRLFRRVVDEAWPAAVERIRDAYAALFADRPFADAASDSRGAGELTVK